MVCNSLCAFSACSVPVPRPREYPERFIEDTAADLAQTVGIWGRKGRETLETAKIDFTAITACGECCNGCPQKESGYCKGCIEADGYVPEWAGSGRCKVHACAREHGVQFCGICGEFPCERLTSVIHWNPNIVEHLHKLAEQYRNQKERKVKTSNIRNHGGMNT